MRTPGKRIGAGSGKRTTAFVKGASPVLSFCLSKSVRGRLCTEPGREASAGSPAQGMPPAEENSFSGFKPVKGC